MVQRLKRATINAMVVGPISTRRNQNIKHFYFLALTSAALSSATKQRMPQEFRREVEYGSVVIGNEVL